MPRARRERGSTIRHLPAATATAITQMSVFPPTQSHVDLGRPENRSTGIDINPRNLALIRERLPNHHAVHGDIEAMPFEDGSFATVLCTEVLEHVPDPAAVTDFKEFGRVLQPGGTLIGSVPARSAIWRLRFLSSTCPHSEPFHNEYLPNEVREMLRGWDIRHLGYSLLRFNVMFVARRSA